MTIGEAMVVLAGDRERRRRDRVMVLAGAWHTAAFSRRRRLPSLASVLAQGTPAPPIDEQRELHQALTEGGGRQ